MDIAKWGFWGKCLEESRRENNHLKLLIEKLNSLILSAVGFSGSSWNE